MEDLLERLESRIAEFAAAHKAARAQVEELEARVEELEQELEQAAADRQAAEDVDAQREQLVERLQKVLTLVDAALETVD